MYRKKCFSFLILVVFIMLGLAGGIFLRIWYKDPLYLFHDPKADKFRIEDNMRLQASGIINSFDFDSIILGTSMLENTSAEHCSKVIGGNFVNISLSGASFWERDFVLRHTLKNKNISNVVYSLDNSYINCAKETQKYKKENWIYLYDDNHLNDFKVYINKKYLKNILFRYKPSQFKTLDRPNAWMNKQMHTCRFGGLQNWVRHKKLQGLDAILTKSIPSLAVKCTPNSKIRHDKKREQKAFTYIEKHILSLAAENKDTKFHLLFPPYWRYRYAEMRQLNVTLFALHQEVVRYMVKRAEQLGNVFIYGFEDCSFVDDVTRYKDTGHYDENVNVYMTESMGKGKHRLTSNNVEAYLTRCDELARAFDFKALNQEVKKLLAKQASPRK